MKEKRRQKEKIWHEGRLIEEKKQGCGLFS